MWTPDGSLACDQKRHKRCDGVAVIIDQDGASRYRCGCWCHKVTPPGIDGQEAGNG